MGRHKWMLAAAGLLVLGFAPEAKAATETWNASVSTTPTNYSTNVSVPQFDTLGGTRILQSVSFFLQGNILADQKYESLDTSPTVVTVSSTATIVLSGPNAANVVTVLPTASNTENATAFDGTFDFGGGSGTTYLGQTGSNSNSNSINSGMAPYIGGGSVSLNVNATGASNGSGSGNLVTQFATSAGAEITVVYTYQFEGTEGVPEPASMALFSMGLLGLGGLKLRRRKG